MFRKLLAACLVAAAPSAAHATDYATAAAIQAAFQNPPSDGIIAIADGSYVIDGKLTTGAHGTSAKPVRVTGSGPDNVTLTFGETDEGIRVSHQFWIIEGVHVAGTCLDCSGAGVHVKIGAHDFTLRNSRVTNWYQGVKSDRDNAIDLESDRGVIANNEFYIDRPIPDVGTMINIDGGEDWLISGNYVHDIGPSGAHYGIFVKGGTRRARILRNLVICSLERPTDGAALGISFGGGGMGPQYCPSDNVAPGVGCACEDFDGLAANNVVMSCNDAGLHTKRACGSTFAFNTVLDVGAGLQVQNVGRDDGIHVIGNVIAGGVSASGIETANPGSVNKLGANANVYANAAEGDFRAGTASATIAGATRDARVLTDYCGTDRTSTTAYGAFHAPGCEILPWPIALTTDPGTDPDPEPTPGGGDPTPTPGGSSDGDATPPPTNQPVDTATSVDSSGCNAPGSTSLAGILLGALLMRRRGKTTAACI